MSRRTLLIALPLIAVLIWIVAFPNVAVIAGSLDGGGMHWVEFLHSPSDREALWTSLWISVASVIASTAIGLPLAFLLQRAEFPGRKVLSAVATLPAALPPLVGSQNAARASVNDPTKIQTVSSPIPAEDG